MHVVEPVDRLTMLWKCTCGKNSYQNRCHAILRMRSLGLWVFRGDKPSTKMRLWSLKLTQSHKAWTYLLSFSWSLTPFFPHYPPNHKPPVPKPVSCLRRLLPLIRDVLRRVSWRTSMSQGIRGLVSNWHKCTNISNLAGCNFRQILAKFVLVVPSWESLSSAELPPKFLPLCGTLSAPKLLVCN